MKTLFKKLGITPGPWEVNLRTEAATIWKENKMLFKARGWEHLTEVTGLNNYVACKIQDANTRLAASAPEMLEALIEMCEDRCHTCRRFNPQHKDCRTCNDIEIGRAVIEKATGKSWAEISELMKEEDEG